MSFYRSMGATARRVLASKGQAMILRRPGAGAYDVATGTTTTTPDDDHPVIGGVFHFPALLIDGTRIQFGDRKVIIAADGMAIEPAPGDLLKIGDDWAKVIESKPTSPAGTPVIYTLQVRR